METEMLHIFFPAALIDDIFCFRKAVRCFYLMLLRDQTCGTRILHSFMYSRNLSTDDH